MLEATKDSPRSLTARTATTPPAMEHSITQVGIDIVQKCISFGFAVYILLIDVTRCSGQRCGAKEEAEVSLGRQ